MKILVPTAKLLGMWDVFDTSKLEHNQYTYAFTFTEKNAGE